jgi:hypothetical protein
MRKKNLKTYKIVNLKQEKRMCSLMSEYQKLFIFYHNRNFFIPKIIVVFHTDLHEMKIKHQIIGEYATKRCFFELKKLTIVTGS